MAKINNVHGSLNIQEAIKMATGMSDKTRNGLIDAISEDMYFTLCRLGIITEGATIDKDNNRKAVWKLTDRAQLFSRIETSEYSKDILNIAQSLAKIGY